MFTPTRLVMLFVAACMFTTSFAQSPPDEQAAARTAKWVSVGESESHKLQMFVDTASIVVTAHLVDGTPIRKAWVRGVFAPGSMHPIRDDAVWSYFVAFESFYCHDKNDRVEFQHIYYESHGLAQEPPEEVPFALDRVAPSSAQSDVIAFVCAWTPK